jgi:hypothetical protein
MFSSFPTLESIWMQPGDKETVNASWPLVLDQVNF